VKDIAGAPHNH